MDWKNRFTPLSLNENDKLPSLVLSYLPSCQAISVSGEDRKTYLQGQLTCDLVTLPESESTLGAHCDAKGKVWSLFRLFGHKDSYALCLHASSAEKALAEIKKYSVFSKVTIELSSDIALGLQGDGADEYINKATEGSGKVRSFMNGSAVWVEDNRWLLLLSEQDAVTLTEEDSFNLASEEAWNLADIKAALPCVTDSNQNEHIPQAFNLHLIGGVSFNKGCYTGQETVARAKYRGTNKRATYILKGKCDTRLEGRVELERNVGQNWRSAGEFLSYYQYADGQVTGIAVLPNNLEPDTKFRLAHQPDSSFVFGEMPYSLESE
ncbi:tRNA-modifying protein YgfZ [Vibrio sp. JC009]|uniref:tRNA-modifying protein YgfZ n=1 Tax=Vibrio sp. JC009 TaxID=2912314 RepID=UPI0023AF7C7C|nr:tRNA-modifying protein YgfZ [Vibrio sp. JC009]WED22235.1 tRNA-modifying protein YgfZ [Vibrio sp. JC009]